MSRRSLHRHRSLRTTLSLAIASALYAGMSYAEVPSEKVPGELESVIVTGSYIRGTAEDSALPVDVISTEDLEKQGSPSLVQLVKQLPAASGGSVGESNRFLGSAAGSATVNLRGFGALRTLVLFNNRRVATSPLGTFGASDINLLPVAAVGSIEVLKDGAAATYGSDAIAGVVNFRTRTDINGFEANTHYSRIQGSNGDYDASLAWGNKLDAGNVLVTAGYRRRSQLRTNQVDWAILPGAAGNAANPFGGWSGASNPGAYSTATGASTFLDDGCVELGGVVASATSCRFQYSNYDNLVNNETHYQLYGEANYRFAGSLKFHGELLFAHHDAPDERVSASQSTVQFPSPINASGGSPGGGTSPFNATGQNQQSRYFIPVTNPGLAAFRNLHCPTGGVGLPAYCASLAGGVITSQTGWRPEGYGGNPLFADGADHQSRDADTYRLSFGLSGDITDNVQWDTALTWMDVKTKQLTPDIVVNRLQQALLGLGGPNCNPLTGTPGAGSCMWFNPFSNGVATSAVNGNSNPFYVGGTTPAAVNSPEVLNWMHQYIEDNGLSRLIVADAVLTGKTPLHMWGDNIAWAAGVQGRYEKLTRDANTLANLDLNPCVDDADDHVPSCTGGSGVYTFYAGISPYDVSRKVYAGFFELDLPLLASDMPGFKSIDFTAAARYESYGGGIGSTTNPKASLKWQFFDWIALRSSFGTTFRAPSPIFVTTGSSRALAQFTDPTTGTSLYRPVDTYNNPNLVPETAKTFNIGLLFKAGGFVGSIDYYSFNFKDELTNETGANIFTTMFPSAAPATWLCSNAALASRFTFAGGVCSPSNFLGVRANQINGPDVDTSGIDFEASYLWNIGRSDLQVGFNANHIVKYERGAVVTLDGFTIASALDRAGTLELLSQFYSYPNWRGNAFVNFGMGGHNLRLDYRYVGSMQDRNHVLQATPLILADVDAFKQWDLTYRLQVTDSITVTAAIQNVADAVPAFAYSQYNYDYTTANPLGRVFEVGLKWKF